MKLKPNKTKKKQNKMKKLEKKPRRKLLKRKLKSRPSTKLKRNLSIKSIWKKSLNKRQKKRN